MWHASSFPLQLFVPYASVFVSVQVFSNTSYICLSFGEGHVMIWVWWLWWRFHHCAVGIYMSCIYYQYILKSHECNRMKWMLKYNIRYIPCIQNLWSIYKQNIRVKIVQRLQKVSVSYLYLFTDWFLKISLQSSKQIIEKSRNRSKYYFENQRAYLYVILKSSLDVISEVYSVIKCYVHAQYKSNKIIQTKWRVTF